MKKYTGFLPNYPQHRKQLKYIAKQLNDLSNRDDSHLADVGCIIGMYTKLLTELQEEIFASHEAELKELPMATPPLNH